MLGEAGARNLCVHAGGDVACAASARRAGRGGWGSSTRAGATAWRRCCARAASRSPPRARTSAARTSSTRARAAARRASLSVTVLGPDLAIADAYATAAFAMGVEGPAWTAGLDDYDALTILADGRVLSTPGVDALRAQIA